MTEDELNAIEAGVLANHGLSKAQVARAAEKEPSERTQREQACLAALITLWHSTPSLTPGDALTIAARAAVQAITDILTTLPLAARAAVVEEAYGGALPVDWADNFKAAYGVDPIPVLLVGGEIAADALKVI
jgi:hypothetical protein